MQLKLNKDSFLSTFITPLSRINNSCKIRVDQNKLTGIVVSESGSPILFSKHETTTGDEFIGKFINIVDLKKFKQILSCISVPEIELNIDNNFSLIKYSDPQMSFKMHLIEDSLMPKCSINENKINAITHDFSIDLPKDELIKLVKASSFATENKKVYFFIKDNTLYAELTDKDLTDFDSLVTCIATNITATLDEIPFDFTILRYLISHSAEYVTLKINNEYKVLFFSINEYPTINNYIISAFVS